MTANIRILMKCTMFQRLDYWPVSQDTGTWRFTSFDLITNGDK